jgi:transposase-like protein
VTKDTNAKTGLPIIAEKVLASSIIYTDDYPIYDNVDGWVKTKSTDASITRQRFM